MKKNTAKSGKKSVFLEPAEKKPEDINKTGVDPNSIFRLHEEMQAFILSKVQEKVQERHRGGNGSWKKTE